MSYACPATTIVSNGNFRCCCRRVAPARLSASLLAAGRTAAARTGVVPSVSLPAPTTTLVYFECFLLADRVCTLSLFLSRRQCRRSSNHSADDTKPSVCLTQSPSDSVSSARCGSINGQSVSQPRVAADCCRRLSHTLTLTFTRDLGERTGA